MQLGVRFDCNTGGFWIGADVAPSMHIDDVATRAVLIEKLSDSRRHREVLRGRVRKACDDMKASAGVFRGEEGAFHCW